MNNSENGSAGAIPGLSRMSPELKFTASAKRAVFVAIIAIVFACYVFDMVFFGSWASHWWMLPVFIIIGWGFRTLVIFLGLFIDQSRDKENRAAGLTLRVIQVFLFGICSLVTISFFAVESTRRATEADRVETVSDAAISAKDERILKLEAQRS